MDPPLTNGSFQIERNYLVYKSFSEHRKYSVYFQYEVYLSYYCLFLILVGSIFNLTSFIIMNRQNMKKYACMRYLAILSIADLTVLYQWNLNTFYKYNLSLPPRYTELEEISLVSCRMISFFAFSSLQISSLLLSIVSFDRVMIVFSNTWTKTMHQPAKINIVITVAVLSILLINSHLLFNNGYVDYLINNNTNTTEPKVSCYKTRTDFRYINPKWQTVHLLLYNAIPFTIMLVCNSLIIYNVVYASKVKSQTKGSSRRKRRMTYMLILITFSFMTLTLPSVILHTFFHTYLSNKPYRRMVNIIVGNFMYTSHAMNFLLYIYSAPNFRDELSKIVTYLKSKFSKKKPDQLTAYKSNMNNMNNNRKAKRLKAIKASTMIEVNKTTNILNNEDEEKEKFLSPATLHIDQIEMVEKS